MSQALSQEPAGCDAPALMSVDAALRRALAIARAPDGQEVLPLDSAHGRITAAALGSRHPLPLFDNSAMDGYALRPADLAGPGPWVLQVAGRVAAGDAGTLDWPEGSALRILTGAPVPEGCGAVVMQEEVTAGAGSITLHRRPAEGANIRRRGEDIPAGQLLVGAGRVLDPRAMSLLAAAGEARVAVRPRLRVSLFATGSELREPGQPLAPGQIWNANRAHLAGALRLPWVELRDLGIIPDDPAALAAALAEAARGADLVISTGGVSVGDEDHMQAVLRRAGARIHVLKLAIKPGKPLTIARLGEAVFVGLPGNPVSAFVTWHVVGARLAEALGGIDRPGLRKLPVRAGFGRSRRPGRAEYLPAVLTGLHSSGMQEAAPLAGAVSHRVALLAGADGLLLIPAEAERVQPGDYLEFIPF